MTTLTQNLTPTVTPGAIKNQALTFLDKAISGFTSLGLSLPTQHETPVQNLLARISQFGTDEAMVIAMVLDRQQAFNQMARDQIAGMQIANRQEQVVSLFNSVVADANTQVKLIDSGRLSMAGKFKIWFMENRRGTFPERFDKIGKVYNSVSKDLGDQVEREEVILHAYQDYRFALKNSEVQAHVMLARAEAKLAETKQALEQSQAVVLAFPADGDAVERSQLELNRDLKVSEHKEMDRSYQIAKDMADQLRVAYNASEFIFASIAQAKDLKARMYEQSVTFFATSDIVLTGLSVKFTQNHGMAEAAGTAQAMTDGIGKALDHLAEAGGKTMEAAVRAGYGPSIKADNLINFINKTVEWQQSQNNLISQARNDATVNAAKIADASEEGKRRYVALLTSAA